MLGLLFNVSLTVGLALLTLWSDSQAMRALTLLTGSGNLIWLFLLLIYHQRVLVQEEAFETEQLRRDRSATGGEGIFDVEDEQLLLARRRLRWMYRWVLLGFTIAYIVALTVAALFYWSWPLGEALSSGAWTSVQHVQILAFVVGIVAFLAFLGSRYVTGMARQRDWRMLHAGATHLMGITLGAVALAAVLGIMRPFPSPIPERVLAYILRILMLALAVETTLNLILDLYRPRSAEEQPRPAFDSRLLGLFTEPGGIARSIADAINYQFGFEVSSTWFYKLLQRSVVPLIGFAILTLVAATSLVFVGSEQQAAVERFGKLRAVVGPGLHLKWPWPVETAEKVDTARLHELKIGLEPEAEEKAGAASEKLILWTNKHSQEPHLTVLVASPNLAKFLNIERPEGPGEILPGEGPSTGPAEEIRRTGGEAVPVSQLRVAVSLQYEIDEDHVYDWLRTYKDPIGMLKAIARREITRYSANVEVGEMLGGDRSRIERALWDAIQDAANERRLGVRIVFLGLQGVHPPSETAEAYEDVIGAEFKQTASVRSARADRNRRLSEMAGDVQRAEQLAASISEVNALRAREKPGVEVLKEAEQETETLFFGDAERSIRPVGGKASQLVSEARRKRWELENQAHGQASLFKSELLIQEAAPGVYAMRRYLETLAEGLQGIRKYVMAASGGEGMIRAFNLNLEDSQELPFAEQLKKPNP
jgi:regulator of protease activity HflC (stomatin/prohibitin superfamily)